MSCPQAGGDRGLVVLPSKVSSGLMQQRSGSTIGGGMGLPHSTTRPAALLHSIVGGEGTRVTNWVQIVELLQQSTASQIRESVAPQPVEVVTIPIWVTVTPVLPAVLVQHDTTA